MNHRRGSSSAEMFPATWCSRERDLIRRTIWLDHAWAPLAPCCSVAPEPLKVSLRDDVIVPVMLDLNSAARQRESRRFTRRMGDDLVLITGGKEYLCGVSGHRVYGRLASQMKFVPPREPASPPAEPCPRQS